MEMSYDDLIKMMMSQQDNTPKLSSESELQQGLLGVGPGSNDNSAEQMMDSMQDKNQANTQNMLATTQQGVQQGMQSAQNLQAQRNAEMNAAQQQASQALAKQQQENAKRGQLFGNLLKMYFTGGLG